MTDMARRVRDLALTLTKTQAMRYHELSERVRSVYHTKQTKGDPTDLQLLYLVERCATDKPIEVADVVRLNLTNTGKAYLESLKKQKSPAA